MIVIMTCQSCVIICPLWTSKSWLDAHPSPSYSLVVVNVGVKVFALCVTSVQPGAVVYWITYLALIQLGSNWQRTRWPYLLVASIAGYMCMRPQISYEVSAIGGRCTVSIPVWSRVICHMWWLLDIDTDFLYPWAMVIAYDIKCRLIRTGVSSNWRKVLKKGCNGDDILYMSCGWEHS